METRRFSACVLISALATYSACGGPSDDEQLAVMVDCINWIEDDRLSSPDCRVRRVEICSKISQPLSWGKRGRLRIITAKGVARELGSLVGVELEGWSYNDCTLVHLDICKTTTGSLYPCRYESCLARVPESCEEYAGR